MQPASMWRGLTIATLLLGSCGCVTVSGDGLSFSWKRSSDSKIEQAKFEGVPEELPPTPKHPERLKLAYARVMEETGQVNEALAQYTEVVEDCPQNTEALLGLSRAALRNGDLDEAERQAKKAVKIAPDLAEAQFHLGQVFAAKSQWNESIAPLTRAMLAAPNETRYRYQLAVSLVHVGDVDSALPHFIRTIGDAEAHYNVGLILQQDGKLDEAERHFLIAVNKKPELTQAQHWLAHLQSAREGGSPSGDLERKADQVVPAGHEKTVGLTSPFPSRNGSSL